MKTTRERRLERVLRACLETLGRVGCKFFACPGPTAPRVDMATCMVCQMQQDILAALGTPVPEYITFKTARKDMKLVDEDGQLCYVVGISRKYGDVVTQREENGARWTGAARWTREQFDARRWTELSGR